MNKRKGWCVICCGLNHVRFESIVYSVFFFFFKDVINYLWLCYFEPYNMLWPYLFLQLHCKLKHIRWGTEYAIQKYPPFKFTESWIIMLGLIFGWKFVYSRHNWYYQCYLPDQSAFTFPATCKHILRCYITKNKKKCFSVLDYFRSNGDLGCASAVLVIGC